MKMIIRAVSAACALAALALCAAFFIAHRQSPVPQGQAAALLTPKPLPSDSLSILFPELSGRPITSLTVSTPDRSFQFHLDHQGMVSVNGQQADSEIFSTLLDQIQQLPVEHYGAFKPRSQDLILTLVVSCGAQKQTARFYEDGGTGEKARIVLESGESPEYRQTSGWRVGTLMMTCEGTRILDSHGNETPAQ